MVWLTVCLNATALRHSPPQAKAKAWQGEEAVAESSCRVVLQVLATQIVVVVRMSCDVGWAA